eukprot:809781-Alexandrium_andersonii.AAC.1
MHERAQEHLSSSAPVRAMRACPETVARELGSQATACLPPHRGAPWRRAASWLAELSRSRPVPCVREP